MLVIDDGATKAVRESGRSLLAVGITEVQVEFGPGALVGLKSKDGSEIACGLANYIGSTAKGGFAICREFE